MSDEQMRLEKLRYQLAGWAYRTWHQGVLVLKIHSAQLNIDKSNTILDRSCQFMRGSNTSFESYGNIARAHEHFFLISLGKFFRWHQTLSQIPSIDIPKDLPILSFRECYYDARNFWEHDDEYLTGKDKHRSRYLWKRRWRNRDGQELKIDSSWSITIGDEYVLANRIEVAPVTLAAKETVQILSANRFGPDFCKPDQIPPSDVRQWFAMNWPPDCAIEALDRL